MFVSIHPLLKNWYWKNPSALLIAISAELTAVLLIEL
jgi:hypothetical protein